MTDKTTLATNVVKKVSNPLTLIGVFAALAEVAATAALPTLNGQVQENFVWFVMLFPTLLVVAFFVTLNFNNGVLYAPSDFKDDAHFMRLMLKDFADIKTFATDKEVQDKIINFWKPNNVRNQKNEQEIRTWLENSAIGKIRITSFLFSDDYQADRRKLVEHLNL